MEPLSFIGVNSYLLQLRRVEDIVQPEVQPQANTSNNDAPPQVKPSYCITCFVPNCPNSSLTTPEKIFVVVPSQPNKRKLWMDAVKREDKCDYKRVYRCCQDHFDLKNDMVNFSALFRDIKPTKIKLKENVVPHIFVCDYFAHLSRKGRVKVLRRLYTPKDQIRTTVPIETVIVSASD